MFVTYEAAHKGGRKFGNTEIAIIEGDWVKSVEVYFDWDIPHTAEGGGFPDETPS